MSRERTTSVLFLCTGNSARSIMAECILASAPGGRFLAYSAGSRPAGAVHPRALERLRLEGHEVAGLRSKSWEEFAAPGAPPIDFVITVCAAAAGEVCPVWPGRPHTAHWGLDDPAAVTGTDAVVRAAFERAYRILDARIRAFTQLRLDALEGDALRRELERIGRSGA